MFEIAVMLFLAVGLAGLIYIARCAKTTSVASVEQDVKADVAKAEQTIVTDGDAIKAKVAADFVEAETDVKADVAKVETKL